MSTIIDGSASVTINSGAILGITSGTAVASTSGTSIDFTSIPSWVKRITVMFSGVSLNSTGLYLIQIGSGSVATTGYDSNYIVGNNGSTNTVAASSSGYIIFTGTATFTLNGSMIITNLTSNTWVQQGIFSNSVTTPYITSTAGTKALSGVLDRIRITSTTGTDTFDAGAINILYEG